MGGLMASASMPNVGASASFTVPSSRAVAVSLKEAERIMDRLRAQSNLLNHQIRSKTSQLEDLKEQDKILKGSMAEIRDLGGPKLAELKHRLDLVHDDTVAACVKTVQYEHMLARLGETNLHDTAEKVMLQRELDLAKKAHGIVSMRAVQAR